VTGLCRQRSENKKDDVHGLWPSSFACCGLGLMVFLSGSALFSLCFEPGGKCPEILRQVGNAPTENRELLVEILNVFIDNIVFDFLYFMCSSFS
jgi:hypothetical protein